jgi:hypothetical protein
VTQPPILLHVGYHKTATSWIQTQLFVPAHGFRPVAGHDEAWTHVVRPHGLRFDPEPLRAILAARTATLHPGEAPVMSSEILSGHPWMGGRESDLYAERLARIAPDARILITIRSQMKILPSVYQQYVLRGGTLPADRFFDGTDELGYFAFSTDHFEYDRLVARYQELFGSDRVLVSTQEHLAAHMDAAAARIARFAGAAAFQGLRTGLRRSVGESYPEWITPVLRRINHVQTSTLDPWPVLRMGHTPYGLFKLAGAVSRRIPWMKARRPISDLVRQRFTGHFAASNARLAKLAGRIPGLETYEGVADQNIPQP